MPLQERIWQLLGEVKSSVEMTRQDVREVRQDVGHIQQRQAGISERLIRVEQLERQVARQVVSPATTWSKPFLAVLALIGAVIANAKADMVAQVILTLVQRK